MHDKHPRRAAAAHQMLTTALILTTITSPQMTHSGFRTAIYIFINVRAQLKDARDIAFERHGSKSLSTRLATLVRSGASELFAARATTFARRIMQLLTRDCGRIKGNRADSTNWVLEIRQYLRLAFISLIYRSFNPVDNTLFGLQYDILLREATGGWPRTRADSNCYLWCKQTALDSADHYPDMLSPMRAAACK